MQVVDGRSMLAHEPADTAAEREPGNSCVADNPASRGEAEALGLAVEFAPEDSSFGPRSPPMWVDVHGFHRRQVDDESVIAHGAAANIMSATPDCDEQVARAREADGGGDVGCVGTPHYGRGPAIDRAV